MTGGGLASTGFDLDAAFHTVTIILLALILNFFRNSHADTRARLDIALNRIDQLTVTLTEHGIAVPPRTPTPGELAPPRDPLTDAGT
jgi:hypothetical protein